jgi:hypothetical protein
LMNDRVYQYNEYIAKSISNQNTILGITSHVVWNALKDLSFFRGIE